MDIRVDELRIKYLKVKGMKVKGLKAKGMRVKISNKLIITITTMIIVGITLLGGS